MSISTLRKAVLCNAISAKSTIVQHLSTVKIEFNVTSTLMLIALMTV